jgi:sulfide:quinone oxidoreductase
MKITQLDERTYVGPQISDADLGELQRLKIGTIIVARPEGETSDQPSIAALRMAAKEHGIAVHQIPVVPGSITDDHMRAYGAIAEEADLPVFACCRSGMRAASLWALNKAANGHPPDEILRAASKANHDLSVLAPRLAENAPS